MEKMLLVERINEYVLVKEKSLVEKDVPVNNMTFTNLRDRIIGIGKILEENFEHNFYIVNVPAGVAYKNHAVVAIQLCEENVAFLAYATEGLINQHTAEKAIDIVIEKISQYLI